MIDAVLRDVFACYPDQLRSVAVESLQLRRGFSGALIFQVETPSGRMALRGWPPLGLPAQRIGELHRLLAHVYDSGVTQVPVPCTARNGQSLVDVGKTLWQLEPWMPGEANYRDDPSDFRLESIMHCLARFHQATSTAATVTQRVRDSQWFFRRAADTSPAVGERLQRIRQCLSSDCRLIANLLPRSYAGEFECAAFEFLTLFERVGPAAVTQLSSVAGRSFRIQPCLRDIWHDHVLLTDLDVTGLIDASACRSDNVAVDLSRLLGSLVGDDDKKWNLALEMYSAVRELTPDELQLVRVLDFSGVLLSGMTWLQKHYLDGTVDGRSERVLARLQHFLGRLRTLAERPK